MSDSQKQFAGVDIGAAFIKAVLMSRGNIAASAIRASGGAYRETAGSVLGEVLAQAGGSFAKLSGIAVTGVGAEGAPFPAKHVSDISCQAMGCRFLFPSARTVIDIGGQFTRAARLTPAGKVADFQISEKCAAGSGHFLQIIARILHIDLADIGPLSLTATTPVDFSTNCAVFAESETVSRLAEGARREDILAGVHRAMAAKVAVLVKRLNNEPDVVLTGGGGEDSGLVAAVNDALGIQVLVPKMPRLTAAIGAACLAEEDKMMTS